MRVMGAANFKALFESARHLYRAPRKQNHRSLLKAVILVGVLFVLSNLLRQDVQLSIPENVHEC